MESAEKRATVPAIEGFMFCHISNTRSRFQARVHMEVGFDIEFSRETVRWKFSVCCIYVFNFYKYPTF